MASTREVGCSRWERECVSSRLAFLTSRSEWGCSPCCQYTVCLDSVVRLCNSPPGEEKRMVWTQTNLVVEQRVWMCSMGTRSGLAPISISWSFSPALLRSSAAMVSSICLLVFAGSAPFLALPLTLPRLLETLLSVVEVSGGVGGCLGFAEAFPAALAIT